MISIWTCNCEGRCFYILIFRVWIPIQYAPIKSKTIFLPFSGSPSIYRIFIFSLYFNLDIKFIILRVCIFAKYVCIRSNIESLDLQTWFNLVVTKVWWFVECLRVLIKDRNVQLTAFFVCKISQVRTVKNCVVSGLLRFGHFQTHRDVIPLVVIIFYHRAFYP